MRDPSECGRREFRSFSVDRSTDRSGTLSAENILGRISLIQSTFHIDSTL